jgi:hypothetical protein
MLRTLAAIVIIFCATFFLPFWVQIGLYVIAIILVQYRAFLLVPALFADAWYSPIRDISPANNKTALLVLIMIVVYLLILSKTRITEKYGLPKK